MNPDDIVIVAARRTPVGSFLGQLSPLSAPALGSAVLQAVLADSGAEAARISEVVMGCVLPAGAGQAPARQAALGAGVPATVGCTTINKVCGSGMKAIMLGHDLCLAGSAEMVLAGGMESMSNAPYLLPKARQGFRFGHQQVLDHMLLDGLENARDGQPMGYFAELCADRYGFSREQQDAFAAESVRRAVAALDNGALVAEIVPLSVPGRREAQQVHEDEQPRRSDIAKIPTLKPVFREGGTVTAANASSLSDGAAAVLLLKRSTAAALGLPPLARIVAHGSHAQAPEEFTTAPIGAIKKLQDKLDWPEADLYEINEAFAVVALAAMKELGLDHAKVNVKGGACAVGHPIGASGARLVVTLLHALRQRGLQRGIAALCIGGGEATAMALEIE
ncbi:thiolase family protein [Nitrosococcus oceani]|uniref:thiolase family protein n=1 Tax=Nitrosococcus oceani TaxID=1229 RepID=UPI0004E9623B|nr:thiolase family protein [Nitrosococcus oceani]KFI22446.1 acetyl-CoA acetyltransferase [Nitrosococcus oceani]